MVQLELRISCKFRTQFNDCHDQSLQPLSNLNDMFKHLITAAALTVATTTAASAEIVSAKCRVLRYLNDPAMTAVEQFPCKFRQTSGNVQIFSDYYKFDFPASEQGKTYIRINAQPLTFTRTGQFSVQVTQPYLEPVVYKSWVAGEQ